MNFTEAQHLEGKDPVVGKIYNKLVKKLHRFGQLKVEPKKTSIHLANRFGFAGVYTRQNYINLEIHLDYRLKSGRVSKVDQASTNRFHHTVKLTGEDDVDAELMAWLKEAYDLKK